MRWAPPASASASANSTLPTCASGSGCSWCSQSSSRSRGSALNSCENGTTTAPTPLITQPADKLVSVLKSNASRKEKADACRELAVIGTSEAVPVLAALFLARDGHRVTVFERDDTDLPPTADEAFDHWDRRGAAHARQSHAILARLRRILREPLLHFLLLGALLFWLYGALNRGALDAPGEIVVDRARVENIAAQFQRTWQRPPTAQELQGLIDSWVREEVYYREGLAQHLDRDDPVVRRRVAQKLAAMADAQSTAEAGEAELFERRARLARTNPMVSRVARVRELVTGFPRRRRGRCAEIGRAHV